jgi:hypothetical protein
VREQIHRLGGLAMVSGGGTGQVQGLGVVRFLSQHLVIEAAGAAELALAVQLSGAAQYLGDGVR